MEMNSIIVYLKKHYKPGHIYIKQHCGLKATAAYSLSAQAEYPRRGPQTVLLFRTWGWESFSFTKQNFKGN